MIAKIMLWWISTQSNCWVHFGVWNSKLNWISIWEVFFFRPTCKHIIQSKVINSSKFFRLSVHTLSDSLWVTWQNELNRHMTWRVAKASIGGPVTCVWTPCTHSSTRSISCRFKRSISSRSKMESNYTSYPGWSICSLLNPPPTSAFVCSQVCMRKLDTTLVRVVRWAEPA